MRLEDEIKQKAFKTQKHKLVVNILFTSSWLGANHTRFFKPYGITSQQFNILRILRGQQGKPATIGLLQDRMLDKMSNASRLVEKLKQKNLVERKECSQDRRQMDVIITPKGLSLLNEIDSIMDNDQTFLNNIGESDAQQINDLLDKMRG